MGAFQDPTYCTCKHTAPELIPNVHEYAGGLLEVMPWLQIPYPQHQNQKSCEFQNFIFGFYTICMFLMKRLGTKTQDFSCICVGCGMGWVGGCTESMSPVYMCVGSGGWHWVSSSDTFHLDFWGRVFLTNLEITSSARLAGHGALGILLFNLTQCWDCKAMLAHWSISYQTQVLIFPWQEFY